MTWMVLSFEQATKRRPSADSFMSVGLEPTGITWVTRLVPVSITLTELLAQLETNKVFPSAEKTSS